MNSATPSPKRGRPKLMIIGLFAVFMGPILLAMFLNIVAPSWLPLGQVNHGRLLEPAIELTLEAAPAGSSELAPWKLGLLATGPCDDLCTTLQAEIKKVLPALGRKEHRVSAIRLSASGAEVTSEDLQVIAVSEFSRLQDLAPNGAAIVLIDPRDFAVLHYQAPVTAHEMLKDLERLLRISKQEAN